MTSLLEAVDVSLGNRLAPTSLSVPAGALVALVGPNGSGKTSLLRALAGIDRDPGPAIMVGGEPLESAPPVRRSRLVGFLPATRSLVWPITVRDVIALGPVAPPPDLVARLLAEFELEPLADRPANHLSTGERSRVLLARALAPGPRLLLLDEPLANLDPHWVLRTMDLLRTAVSGGKCSAIVSLHDLGQADHFDRLLLMSGGRIVEDGPPKPILGGDLLGETFRIERSGKGWAVRPSEGRRSSP